jgi:hypothetical protein
MTKRFIGLEAFKNLTVEEQLNILHKDGVHVGKRTVEDQPVILFQVNDFYVEVHYKEYRKDVNKLLVSDNVDMVHPYLKQIQVKGLDNKDE